MRQCSTTSTNTDDMGNFSSKHHQQVLRPGSSWVNDEQLPACHRCFENFTVTRRRHHCRMCGAIYCSACCPDADKIPAAAVRANVSFPAEQRALERVCLSCRLPMWLLPMQVPRPPARAEGGGKHAALSATLLPTIDGTVMQTILEFLDDRSRSRVLQTHPAVRHFLPMPDVDMHGERRAVPMRPSVSVVFPGVVALGDGPHAGSFRRGTPGIFAERAPVGLVGMGGFGSVYFAMQRLPGGCVVPMAVKLIAKENLGGPRFSYKRTFGVAAAEIAIQSSLKHPNIVALRHVFQTPRHIVMVSDAGEGRTVKDAAIAIRALDVQEPRGLPRVVPFTLRVIRAVTVALQHMASKGFVHRDMKLDNVILSRDYGHVRVIDFGLTEPIKPRRHASYAPVGTPSYLSPENCLAVGSRLVADRRTILASDVFSLGVMAHMILSNKRVYGAEAGRDYRLMARNIEAGVRCCGSRAWEGIPASVCALVESMLAFDPRERPTFEEILRHPCLTEYASEMEALVDEKHAALLRDDRAFTAKWDMLDDADDSDADSSNEIHGSNVATGRVHCGHNLAARASAVDAAPAGGLVVGATIGTIDPDDFTELERTAASVMFPSDDLRCQEQSMRLTPELGL